MRVFANNQNKITCGEFLLGQLLSIFFSGREYQQVPSIPYTFDAILVIYELRPIHIVSTLEGPLFSY